MNGIDSINYGNAFEKQEERKRNLKELAEKYQYEGLLKLASRLGITPEDLMRILAGVQGIDEILDRRIDLLWIEKFGTVYIKVPKPFLNLDIRVPEPPTIDIKMCSAFTRLTGLEDKNTIYEAINTRHVLSNYVEPQNYNPTSINRIANWLEEWSVTFFRKKDKSMRIVKATELSVSTHYGRDCPNSPRLEYELLDIETGEPRYGFIYTKGKIIWSIGNLPLSEISSIVKDLGVWEN